jgi:hypothetical protein
MIVLGCFQNTHTRNRQSILVIVGSQHVYADPKGNPRKNKITMQFIRIAYTMLVVLVCLEDCQLDEWKSA